MSKKTEAIHSRAMLVRLTVRFWAGRKLDKNVSEQINRTMSADPDAGRYWKWLLGGRIPSHQKILQIAGQARAKLYEHTLPWGEDAERLLPTANYMKAAEEIGQLAMQYDSVVDTFLAEYPRLRREAEKKLGALYDPAVYPSESYLRRRFAMQLVYTPLPFSDDFRLSLPGEQLKEIRATAEAAIQERLQVAMGDVWERLYARVAHMHERLSDPEGIFRDSLVENVRDIVAVLDRLNVTGDAKLERMRVKVAKELATREPNVLRHNAEVRESTAQKAAAIMAQMESLYGAPLGQRDDDGAVEEAAA